MAENNSNDMSIKLTRVIAKVGDLSFRRRVVTLLNYLDIQSTDKVLDAGCGEGFYVMLLSELYDCNVTGLDFDPEILSMAKKWIKDTDRIKLLQGNVTDLPFPENYFDKIIISEVLEHVPDDAKALSEVYRVLKPGGILVITVPNKNYPLLWDPFNWVREHLHLGHFSPESGFFGGIWAMHLRLYDQPSIERKVKEAGFRVEQADLLTHYCLPFNHNILYVGKQFYTRLPVPESVSSSMEKFEWEKSEKKFGFDPIAVALRLMSAVDNLNETRWNKKGSSLHIALKAIKPQ